MRSLWAEERGGKGIFWGGPEGMLVGESGKRNSKRFVAYERFQPGLGKVEGWGNDYMYGKHSCRTILSEGDW